MLRLGREKPLEQDRTSIATTDCRMTTDELKSELIALRQRMFDGPPIAEIQRLGRMATNLLRHLKEAGADVPKAHAKIGRKSGAAGA